MKEKNEAGGERRDPPGSVSGRSQGGQLMFGRRDKRPPRQTSTWREDAEALVMAVLLAMFIRTFVVQAFKIPSGSMLPTLQIGDHLLVNKFLYGIRIPLVDKRILALRAPAHDDVVVFIYPQD